MVEAEKQLIPVDAFTIAAEHLFTVQKFAFEQRGMIGK
jgi:hypothetical protein